MEVLKIGISSGDINGIGLEVILKTLNDKRILELCTPIIYGSSKVVSYHKNIVNFKGSKVNSIREAEQAKDGMINVVNCWNENVRIALGEITEEGGKYAYIALDQAVNDLNAKKIDALVTAPINKKAMQMANFPYTGHTEFLAAKAEVKDSLMMMVNDQLRVGLATNHIPISEIPQKLNKEVVMKKIRMMHNSLCQDFGINRPKIAVLGLNPHAGDDGSIGKEEQEYILPAIQKAKKEGIMAIGPYPADGFFGSGNYKQFDGILAMFHDQGLVAFKALSFEAGVNFTAGLPFVRTSPDHGTAFNIVGQNIASYGSFRQALYLAIDIVRQRADFAEMTKNPLKPISVKEFEKLAKEDEDGSDLPEDGNYQEFIPVSGKLNAALEEGEDEEEDDLLETKEVEEDLNEEEEDLDEEEEEEMHKEVQEIIEKRTSEEAEDGDGETL
jgi:4-hydroxythreonine-4-phosphate dehydrogenase